VRTPYDRRDERWAGPAQRLAASGFVAVVQDVRGRGDSQGYWRPFWNEGRDGYDTIEWVAAQPWCTGRVGTMGGSYNAWAQWAAAREAPAHLTCMVSSCAGGRVMKEWPTCDGMLTLQMLSWLYLVNGRTMQDTTAVDWDAIFHHRPLRTMDVALGGLPMWQECVEHTTLGYWRDLELSERDFSAIDVPTLHVTGWWDGPQPGLFFHAGMTASSPASCQPLLVGPWDHEGSQRPKPVVGGVDFSAGLVDHEDMHRRWFGHWLRDEPMAVAPVRWFCTGGHEWVESASWPPPGVEARRLNLHSGGRANSLRGDGVLRWQPPGDEPADSYLYDPDNPVSQLLDFDPFQPSIEAPLDRRYVARRPDVLVYTTEPAQSALCIAGDPTLELHAASDCPDTDWVVSLADVDPSGRSMQLAEGRLRARFRESLEYETLMEPGVPYRFTIELTAVGHVIRPGHRLRLAITSSDFPIYDTNTNTGRPIADDTEPRIARNTVLHSGGHASYLVLPVLGVQR
jgi:hypothetical protein